MLPRSLAWNLIKSSRSICSLATHQHPCSWTTSSDCGKTWRRSFGIYAQVRAHIDVEFHAHRPSTTVEFVRGAYMVPEAFTRRNLLVFLGLAPYCDLNRHRCLIWRNHVLVYHYKTFYKFGLIMVTSFALWFHLCLINCNRSLHDQQLDALSLESQPDALSPTMNTMTLRMT